MVPTCASQPYGCTDTSRAQESAPTPSAAAVIAQLRRLGDRKTRAGLARFGLPIEKAFGVPMHKIHKLAKEIGPEHTLALELWKSGWTDARSLAAFIDEPERVTPAQMEKWVRDFDSWGICDTVCFKLFDRTPHAFAKIRAWARRKEEFQKRAAFALLASLALHDRESADARFLRTLPLIERAASDERNFVKKGVSWALRALGHRSPGLHAAALELARGLAASQDASERWIGKDILRDLERALVKKRLEARARRGIRCGTCLSFRFMQFLCVMAMATEPTSQTSPRRH